MADWEHKDERWFFDGGDRLSVHEKTHVSWQLRIWVSDDGTPIIIKKYQRLLSLSPDADESQKESFSDEYKKIDREFREILTSQLKFSEWLNLQTKGGWEVFKISDREPGIWCVFRRKTE